MQTLGHRNVKSDQKWKIIIYIFNVIQLVPFHNQIHLIWNGKQNCLKFFKIFYWNEQDTHI